MTRFASLALALVAMLLTASAPSAQCTHTWINTSGGSWNTAADWSPAAVPGPSDDACITMPGTYTVTLTSGAAASVNSLTLGGASGTQTLNSTLAITIANGSSIEANGVWQWSNGVLSGGATLTNNGLVIVDGSPIGASRRIDGLGTVLNNLATMRLERDDTYLRDDGALVSSGTIEVNQIAGSDAQILQDGVDTGSRLFTNTGTIDVQAGTFDIRAESRHDGATLEVASGATLEFEANTHAFAGTTMGTPAGDLLVNAAITAEAGAVWNVGGTGIQWRTGFLSGGETLTNTGLVVLNGSPIGAVRGVAGLGTVFSNTGTTRLESDDFYLRDDGAFVSSGTIEVNQITGSDAQFLQDGVDTGSRLFTNTGTIDVQAGTFDIRAESRHDGATLEVASGATLEFEANTHAFAGTTMGTPAGDLLVNAAITAEAGAVWNVGGTGIQWRTGFLSGGETLTNTGLVVLNGSPIGAVRGVSDLGTTFANTGTVEWGSDEFFLRDDGSMSNAGTINGISNGGQVSRLNITGTGTRLFTNTGTIHVQVGILELESDARHDGATLDVDVGAELNLDGGNHTFAGTTSGTAEGDLLLTTGAVAEAGAVWNVGGLGIQWRFGFLTGGETLTNTGRIDFNGSPIGAVRGVSDLGTLLDNQGHVQWTADEFYLRDDGAMINNGTMTVLRDGSVPRFGLTGSGAARIFTNAGTVAVDTSTTFDVNVPLIHQAGAVIAGSGTFDIAGSTFTHDGDTAPGLSPGILTWTGKPWAAPSGGALTIEIGGTTVGTEYDQLSVNGAATLDGTLEIDVTSTAGLTVGDTFTILTASGGVTGTFSSIAVGGIPGPEFSVTYNAGDVVLELTSLANPLTLRGRAGWRTLSTPFPDLPLGGRDTYGMLRDIYTAGYLGADRDQRNNRGTANVFLYDESTGEFTPPDNAGPIPGGSAFWVYVFIDDDSYTPGSQGGFPKTLLSSGTPATFPFDIPVTYTPGLVRGPETPALGFNLVGNPANSDLDWDDPNWTKTNVSDVLYIYDPKVNDNDGGWLTWNGTTGTLPTEGLIPVGQGFHVETTGTNPALTVPSSAVLGTQSPLYRLTEDTPPEAASSKTEKVQTPEVRFRLDAAFGDTERTAEAIISFDEAATLGFDRRDARLLAAAPGGTLARLYTTVGDAHDEAGAALQVASMPAPTEGVLQIDLGADVLASGDAVDADATLAWEAVALPTLWTATLVDRATGERYDLTDAGSASLALNAADALTVTDADKGISRSEEAAAIELAVEAGDLPPTPKSPEARALHAVTPAGTAKSGATRFVIEIDPEGVLNGATEPEISAVYPNPASRVARVEFRLPDDTDVRVALYDVLGRRVAAVHDGPLAAGVHTMEMPVADLAPGTYLVRVDGAGLGQSLRLTVAR